MRVAVSTIVLGILAGTTAAAQEWVSQVKTRPLEYEGREILLEGEVVEVRAVSPRSARGLYRLVDGSDPSGVLVRTNDLPMAGGPFRVRARIAPEFLYEGQLLLDEEHRSAAGLPLRWLALAVLATGLVGLAGTGLWLHRIRQEERRLKLGRPMWLIPVEEQPVQVVQRPGGPPVFDYKLHYIEEERSAEFERRRRRLLVTLAASTVVTVVGVGGSIALRVADASRPSFVLLMPEAAPADPLEPRTQAAEESLAPTADEPVQVGLAPRPPAARGTERGAEQPRQSAPTGVAPPQQPAEAARQVPVPIESVLVRPPVESVVLPPPPAPVLVPPPAQPEPVRDDPAVLLVQARREVEAGAQRLVQALNGRRFAEVEGLVLATGDTRQRDRFVQFVREFQPSATLSVVDEPTLAEPGAVGGFAVGFRWRGDFGVQRQRLARFQAVLRRAGDGWVLDGVRMLEAIP